MEVSKANVEMLNANVKASACYVAKQLNPF